MADWLSANFKKAENGNDFKNFWKKVDDATFNDEFMKLFVDDTSILNDDQTRILKVAFVYMRAHHVDLGKNGVTNEEKTKKNKKANVEEDENNEMKKLLEASENINEIVSEILFNFFKKINVLVDSHKDNYKEKFKIISKFNDLDERYLEHIRELRKVLSEYNKTGINILTETFENVNSSASEDTEDTEDTESKKDKINEKDFVVGILAALHGNDLIKDKHDPSKILHLLKDLYFGLILLHTLKKN